MGAIRRWLSGGLAPLAARLGFGRKSLSETVITSGRQAERLAEQFLWSQGLTSIKRNHNTPMGEVDLIMMHGECLVFVEVRYRQQTDWASALETVTRPKQQRIIKAAQQYLQKHRQYLAHACRFDVLGIDCVDGHNQFSWVQHAFE